MPAATKPIAVSEEQLALTIAQVFQPEASSGVKQLRSSGMEVKGARDQKRIESGCDIVGYKAAASDSQRGRKRMRFWFGVMVIIADWFVDLMTQKRSRENAVKRKYKQSLLVHAAVSELGRRDFGTFKSWRGFEGRMSTKPLPIKPSLPS